MSIFWLVSFNRKHSKLCKQSARLALGNLTFSCATTCSPWASEDLCLPIVKLDTVATEKPGRWGGQFSLFIQLSPHNQDINQPLNNMQWLRPVSWTSPLCPGSPVCQDDNTSLFIWAGPARFARPARLTGITKSLFIWPACLAWVSFYLLLLASWHFYPGKARWRVYMENRPVSATEISPTTTEILGSRPGW